MGKDSYFGRWTRVISPLELERVNWYINQFIQKKVLICPDVTKIFRAFELCKYEDLKVVMIGQDPYPQKDIATGILFGNNLNTREEDLSPSLQIIKEAAINLEVPKNNITFDNSLEEWAKQGILMLNSSLTVEMNKVGSHYKLWRPFIIKLLQNLSIWDTGIIYVLFGNTAQTLAPYINKESNIIISEIHPAYYARIGKKMPSTVFEEVSKLTKEKYGEPIKWFTEY